MKIRSFEDIPEFIFWPLKQWADASIYHFNFIIGVGLLLIIVSFIWLFTLRKIIGRADERTQTIYLKALMYGVTTFIICKIIFPDTYLIKQFEVYSVIFGLLTTDVYLQIRCIRDQLHSKWALVQIV